ncbi:hypothetical protein GCM10027413_05440 [Conyzicola nivalis]|uniref:Uncharacterized protein n=1 Tax=Conyzicola nivalis TaxID=1477021 RepID=A0A916WKI3_9MICO|nr:hypothetical protein [Conyzicola nivalis]GGB06223.1 hypothetical protein GCM10010979_21190 [Conyzicola nivalis]
MQYEKTDFKKTLPRLEPGETIFVVLAKSSTAIPGVAARFRIPDGGLDDEGLLHEDGRITAEKCAGISAPSRLR